MDHQGKDCTISTSYWPDECRATVKHRRFCSSSWESVSSELLAKKFTERLGGLSNGVEASIHDNKDGTWTVYITPSDESGRHKLGMWKRQDMISGSTELDDWAKTLVDEVSNGPQTNALATSICPPRTIKNILADQPVDRVIMKDGTEMPWQLFCNTRLTPKLRTIGIV